MTAIINGTTGITAPGTETFGDGTALGGATNPIVSMAKGASGYVQSYIVNNTNGTSSSADIVAYPSNGTDSHGWVDMGITSLAYADTTYTVTGPNESYLFASAPSGSSTTGNLVIATDNTGTANSIQFYTNGFTQAKSAARMTIDSIGSIGIGVTPNAWDVGYTPIQGSGYSLYSGNASQVRLSANEYYSATGPKYRNSFAATLYQQSAGVHSWSYAASGTAGNAITFTEAARIDSSGNLLVGTSTAGSWGANCWGFQIASGFVVQGHANGTASGTQYIYFDYNNGPIGSITQNGTTAVAYNTTSDYRLKENVQPLSNALARVAALKPCTYTWKSAPDEIGEGFIAHELQEVCPQAVTGEKDDVDEDGNAKYQSIDTSFLVATLTAAIQEQQALITQLQADVETLKGKA